jgi:hypothetical protein
LWAAVWLVFGVNDGLVVTPTHEIPAPVDRASYGLPPYASEFDFKMAILDAGDRGTLPKGTQVPSAFNPFGTVVGLCFAASAPAVLFVIGWACAGFSGAVRRR